LKPRTASSISRVFIGAAIGCFVFFAIGCPAGCAIGWRVAFHENDGGSEILYQLTPPVSTDGQFWLVLYDEQDRPTLQHAPLPIFDLTPGQRTVPARASEASTGPWSGPGPPDWVISTIPAGEHEYQAGGVSFVDQGGTVQAELIVYPSKPANGWIREYYTYEIRGTQAHLIRSMRERSFNEWGGEMLAIYAIPITVAFSFVGLILGGVVGSMTANKAH
jgi:hypothetical protein